MRCNDSCILSGVSILCLGQFLCYVYKNICLPGSSFKLVRNRIRLHFCNTRHSHWPPKRNLHVNTSKVAKLVLNNVIMVENFGCYGEADRVMKRKSANKLNRTGKHWKPTTQSAITTRLEPTFTLAWKWSFLSLPLARHWVPSVWHCAAQCFHPRPCAEYLVYFCRKKE